MPLSQINQRNYLADFNKAVVWMVSVLPLISSPSNLLGYRSKVTNYNSYHSHVPQFLSSPARSKYLSIFLLCFISIQLSARRKILFFFLFIKTKFGRQVGIQWSVSMWKFQRMLSLSFCRTESSLSIYYLVVLSNFNFL